MNKRFCTRANRLFRYSHKGDTARRESDTCCAFYCALPERARTFILTLLMVTLTLVASPFVMGDSEAHAYLSEDKTTATVADFDELKKAVEGSDGYANVRNIVIDPQAAIDFTDINDENAQVSYGDGAFYIPIEQPIRVSRDVTITNAEGVQVVFARSKKGGNGDYDSKAFAGANADWPALFNVISSRGTLTIEGDIVMTGEVVSADFNEEEASFTFDAEANEWSRGNGTGIVDGGYFIHSVNGGEVVVNEGVTLTELVTDNTVTNAAPVYLGGGSTYTMNGGAITGNSFAGSVKDVKDATTAGGIIVMDDKTSATLNEGEISNNSADVAGVIVREGSELNVGKSFAIDDNEIYREEATKATEETTVAPKKSLRSAKAPATQMRSGSSTSKTVKSSLELKQALANGNNPIILDSSLKDAAGNYYIGIDEPLTVDYEVEIRTANIGDTQNKKEVIIARTDKFADKVDGANPAIFNVTSNGHLTLSEKVTMTGDELTLPKVVKMDLSVNGLYFGEGSNNYFAAVQEDKGAQLSLDPTGHLVYYDSKGKKNVVRWDLQLNPVIGNGGSTDYRLLPLKENGQPESSPATQLEAGRTYVAWFPSTSQGDQYIMYDSSKTNKLYRTGNVSQAIIFKAEAVSGTGDNALKVNHKVWTADEVKAGGYFIDVKGGKVTINDGVTIKNLTTAADVSNVAPVVVRGDSNSSTADDGRKNFVMNGGSIEGNKVGYLGDSLDSTEAVKTIAGKIKGSDGTGLGNMTNTAGGVIFTDKATATIAGGQIKGNKGDAGGIIVTEEAHVKFTSGKLNSNIGVHHAGAAHVEHGGTLVMDGANAEMKNNIAWYKGGAVWATEWGTSGYAVANWSMWPKEFPTLTDASTRSDKGGGNFVLNNGTIQNNTAFARAGAIEVESNGVQLNGGLIDSNYCRSLGGAIYIEGDSPNYSYSLVLPRGYITENTAVFRTPASNYSEENALLDRKIGDNLDAQTGSWLITNDNPGDNSDGDFAGAMGNGGGIWLCPVGGTSVFTGGDILIWDNDAERTNGGEDFYLHKGNGAAMLQSTNLQGDWFNEVTQTAVAKNMGVVSGPLSMTNRKDNSIGSNGVVITNNIARDGGAIACNGTFIIGEPDDVHRFNSRLDMTKTWAAGTAPAGKTINLKLQYKSKDGSWKDLTYVGADADDNGNPVEEVYEVDLNGNGDDDNIGVSDIISENAPINANTWSASAFIPLYVMEGNEKTFLYTLKNPKKSNYAGESGFANVDVLDLSNDDHVGHLYKYIDEEKKAGRTPSIEVANWNLQIVESVKIGNRTYKCDISYPTTGAGAGYAETIILNDPINGNELESFQITYSTVTFGATLSNSINDIDLDLYKQDNYGTGISGVNFVLAEAARGGSQDFRFAGTENGWEAAEHNKTYEHDTVKFATATSAGNNGHFRFTGLKPGGIYFLFESNTPNQYKPHTAPWLVQVSENGSSVTVRAIEDSYKNKVNYNPGPNGGDNQPTADYNDKKVWHRYWKEEWFVAASASSTTLTNDCKPIELNKVDSNGSPLSGGTYKLYDATVVNANNGDLKVAVSTARTSTSTNGKITFENVQYGKTYFLFEESTPNGYKKPNAPWLVKVASNGAVSVYTETGTLRQNEGGGSAYGKYYKDTAPTGVKDLVVPTTYTESFFSDKLWVERWFSTTPVDNKQIVNRKAAIVLEKTDDANDPARIKNNTAKFMIFDTNVKVSDLFDENGNAKTGNQDVKVRDKNAPIGGDANGDHTTDAEGFLSIDNLDTDKIYLLFEAEAPEGYQRSKAPWLIWIDKNGDSRIFRYVAKKVKVSGETNPSDLDRGDVVGWSNERDNLRVISFPTTAEGYDVPEGVNTQGFNYLEQTGNDKSKLKNAPIEIDFEKIAKGTDLELTGAKFDLYYATTGDSNNYQNGLIYKVDTSKPNKGLISSNIGRNNDGKYKVSIPKADGIYLLFESVVPNGYVDPVVPWGIYVDADGNVKPLDGTNYGIWGLDPSYTDAQIAAIRARFANETDKTKIFLECKEIKRLTSYELENEPKPIELIKVDETAAKGKLGGAKFVICEAVVGSEKDHGNGQKSNHYWVKNARIGGTNQGKWIPDSTILTTAVKGSDNQPRIFESEANTGKIVIDDLEAGNYLLFEYQAPTGFVRATSPWVIKVTDSSDGRTVTVRKVKDAAKGKALYSKGDETIDIAPNDLNVVERWWDVGVDDAVGWFESMTAPYELRNEPKYLTKVDADTIGTDNVITLEGAKFHLYGTHTNEFTVNGVKSKYIRRDSSVLETAIESGAGGRIQLPSSVTKNPGNYFLEEDSNGAPDGYAKANYPWLINVDSQGNIKVLATKVAHSYSNNYGNWWKYGNTPSSKDEFKEVSYSDSYIIPNDRLPMSLTKVNGYNTNEKLGGAKFEVYKYTNVSKSGSTYTVTFDMGTSKETTESVAETGIFTLPYTADGYYLLKEIKAPNNYAVSETMWVVTIFSNYGYNYETVYAYKAHATNSTNKFTFNDASTGGDCVGTKIPNYPTVSLTKVELNDGIIKGTDINGDETITLNTATDEVNYLENVGFKLYDANTSNGTDHRTNTWTAKTPNSPVMVTGAAADGTIRTNNSGVLELGALPNGKYLLQETEENTGFVRPNNPWRLVVQNGTVTVYAPLKLSGATNYVKINPTDGMTYITNSRVYELPHSGGMGTYWFMVIGAMMMAFAATMVFARRRGMLT